MFVRDSRTPASLRLSDNTGARPESIRVILLRVDLIISSYKSRHYEGNGQQYLRLSQRRSEVYARLWIIEQDKTGITREVGGH